MQGCVANENFSPIVIDGETPEVMMAVTNLIQSLSMKSGLSVNELCRLIKDIASQKEERTYYQSKGV